MSNTFVIKKANKLAKKLRIGFSAPSGGGKTMSALLCAYGLVGDWDKIVVIDTERESASLYADLGSFSILPLSKPYTPERYINAIRECENADFEVIIIDSTSHEWNSSGGILEIVADLGGEYRHWKTVTPRHNAFIDAILTSKCHVFCTTRRKEGYTMTTGEGGKAKVVKLGLEEVQRNDFSYEMDLVFDIEQNHYASSSKDRTMLFPSNESILITEETGKTLRDWAAKGRSMLDDAMDLLRATTDRKSFLTVYKSYPSLHNNADFIALGKQKDLDFPKVQKEAVNE